MSLVGVDPRYVVGGSIHEFARLDIALSNAEASEGFDAIPLPEGISRAVRRFRFLHQNGSRVFFVGNGASAAIADHMAADFLKNGNMASQSFAAPALMTCIGNDLGFENVFAEPILRHGKNADLLVAISSSGKSPNILKAIEAAGKRFMSVMTFTGFAPDNPARKAGHLNFWVPSDRYGCVEVAHHAILHTILDRLVEVA